MRLSFRLIVVLGTLLLLLSGIQPASASEGFSKGVPASQAPGSSVVFEHLTIEDGLNRYDGYNFTTFKPDPDNENILNHNSVIALHEDRKNNRWIGTWVIMGGTAVWLSIAFLRNLSKSAIPVIS